MGKETGENVPQEALGRKTGEDGKKISASRFPVFPVTEADMTLWLDRQGVTVLTVNMPGSDKWGAYDKSLKRVYLSANLNPFQLRATLAHVVYHVLLNHGGAQRPNIEARIDTAVAALLIPEGRLEEVEAQHGPFYVDPDKTGWDRVRKACSVLQVPWWTIQAALQARERSGQR